MLSGRYREALLVVDEWSVYETARYLWFYYTDRVGRAHSEHSHPRMCCERDQVID